MQSIQMFGTKLRGSIEDVNLETELVRIGLSFTHKNGSLWIESGPTSGANLANRLGVGKAISRHLSAGGISLEWPIANSEAQWIRITPNEVEEF